MTQSRCGVYPQSPWAAKQERCDSWLVAGVASTLQQEHLMASQQVQGGSQPDQADHGPKYFLDIEGTEHPWPRETITTEEIAKLGGWELAQGVIEIDADNNERTLQPGETVQLKPGKGFSKKIHWKRG
jgi:hypothetical protein